jgi:DNA polymerase-4
VIPPARGAAFVETLPVAKFHGVGPATAARMAALGIVTGADLKAQTPEFLTRHFGKAGGWYHAIARGIDNRPVQPHRTRKSLGSEDTFLVDITDPAQARSEALVLAAKVWRQAAARGLAARSVVLKVKFADFRQITRSRTLPGPISSEAELAGLVEGLLLPLFPVRLGIRLLGVTLSQFGHEAEGARQLSLFSDR